MMVTLEECGYVKGVTGVYLSGAYKISVDPKRKEVLKTSYNGCYTPMTFNEAVAVGDIIKDGIRTGDITTDNRFDPNDYKGKFVIHCKNEREAEDYCDLMYRMNKRWYNGASYNGSALWDTFKEDTAYSFNYGNVGNVSTYKKRGYTVLEYSDFVWY